MILTCEHATRFIPKKQTDFFKPHEHPEGPWGKRTVQQLLDDHWGWDLGALGVARHLQQQLKVPLVVFPLSRLLLEPEDLRNPPDSLFRYGLAASLPLQDKQQLYHQYWLPHIQQIEHEVKKARLHKWRLLHFGIHTFTPVKNGVRRITDIGIQFDTKRPIESALARKLKHRLQPQLPGVRIRLNYPYRGASEGLTSWLRKKFSGSVYAGFEMEVNNIHVRTKTKTGVLIQRILAKELGALQ